MISEKLLTHGIVIFVAVSYILALLAPSYGSRSVADLLFFDERGVLSDDSRFFERWYRESSNE